MERVRMKGEPHRFRKGEPRVPTAGRRLGTPNKITTQLNVAILEAAAMVGRDEEGEDGLHGYLMHLAINHPKVYGRLLEKVLPMTVHIRDDATPKKYETIEDLAAELRARGLPPPSKLIEINPRPPRRSVTGERHNEHVDGLHEYEDA